MVAGSAEGWSVEMDTKACTKCGEIKPFIDFHKASKSKDGRRSACAKCCNAYFKTPAGKAAVRRYLSTENSKARVKAVNARSDTKAAKLAYARSERGRKVQLTYKNSAAGKASAARTHSARPWLRRGASAVAVEINAGRQARAADLACEAGPIGCAGRHELHHDSYLEKDLKSVRCLCVAHHTEWHANNTPRTPEA